MMRMSVAFRAFFAALSSHSVAEQLAAVLDGKPEKPAPSETGSRRAPAARSEALTLLSALQRDARLIDFVKESLDGATDDQIGAVVRDVHRDCATVIERMFAIRPLLEKEEGDEIDVLADFDASRFRLTGNVQGEPPYRGSLAHHGWRATRCELPDWTGGGDNALLICPAIVELP